MNRDIEVLDNLLPQSYYLQIKEKVTDTSNFPWYYQNNITASNYDCFGSLEMKNPDLII